MTEYFWSVWSNNVFKKAMMLTATFSSEGFMGLVCSGMNAVWVQSMWSRLRKRGKKASAQFQDKPWRFLPIGPWQTESAIKTEVEEDRACGFSHSATGNMKLFVLIALFGLGFAQHNPNTRDGRTAIVHLFEWRWADIAAECERFLGPKGFAGVQVEGFYCFTHWMHSLFSRKTWMFYSDQSLYNKCSAGNKTKHNSSWNIKSTSKFCPHSRSCSEEAFLLCFLDFSTKWAHPREQSLETLVAEIPANQLQPLLKIWGREWAERHDYQMQQCWGEEHSSK